jgi:hypothetical protein
MRIEIKNIYKGFYPLFFHFIKAIFTIDTNPILFNGVRLSSAFRARAYLKNQTFK